MNAMDRHEEDLEAVLNGWNAQLQEWHVQVASLRARERRTAIGAKIAYGRPPGTRLFAARCERIAAAVQVKAKNLCRFRCTCYVPLPSDGAPIAAPGK